MRRILPLLLSIIVFPAAAQKYFNRLGIIKDADSKNGLYLKLNVLSVADIGLPTFQPGLEYKINQRFGLELAIGIPLNNVWSKRQTDSTFYRFYKIRTTAKYYTAQNFYFGLETFYVYSRYNIYYGRYMLQNKGYYTSDYTVNNKRVLGFDIKYGKAITLGNKWYIENFIGAGFRIVTLSQPVNINPTSSFLPNHGFFTFYDVVGTKYTPHLTCGLLLVYKL
jgi:hypothetical protein